MTSKIHSSAAASRNCAARIVRTVLSGRSSGGAAANARKSCAPSSASAARSIASRESAGPAGSANRARSGEGSFPVSRW